MTKKNKKNNWLAIGIFWFMAVEFIMIAIIYFNAKATSQLLTDIGITLSYFPFVTGWFIIITIINFYMNLITPMGQHRRKGLIR